MNPLPDDSPEMLQRREILRRAAWLLGGAISAPAAMAVLQGCSAREEGADGAWKPAVLGEREYKIVSAVADTMIPRTDTSGALDAGVPTFIDAALAALYVPSEQQRFKSGCELFDAAAGAAGGKTFLELDAAGRAAYVRQALESALAEDADQKPFVLMARELTLLGYFTSKVGITENMEYVPVPTAFQGCVPLSQMKKHVYWE